MRLMATGRSKFFCRPVSFGHAADRHLVHLIVGIFEALEDLGLARHPSNLSEFGTSA